MQIEVNTERIRRRIGVRDNYPQPGVTFRDVWPLFADPELRNYISNVLATEFYSKVDVVYGIESRGFPLGMLIADRLKVPFQPIRKRGKPFPEMAIEATYGTEYSQDTLCIARAKTDNPEQRILIADDLIATGGSILAAAALTREVRKDLPKEKIDLTSQEKILAHPFGSKTTAISIINLPRLGGSETLRNNGISVFSLVEY